MKLNVAARSDTGCHRERNEDSFHVDTDNDLYIICDGMGGHPAGAVASKTAIDFTVDYLGMALDHRILPGKNCIDFIEVWEHLVVETIEKCCDHLCDIAGQRPHYDGMATTITVVLIVDGVAFVGHLGDSRLYFKNGEVARQLTNDHTLYEEFMKANSNQINPNGGPVAMQRFRHILTQCAGRNREISVESFNFHLTCGDQLLLCTGGLSKCFPNESLVFEFLNGGESESIIQQLFKYANSQGEQGVRDDATAIFIKVANMEKSKMKNPLFQAR